MYRQAQKVIVGTFLIRCSRRLSSWIVSVGSRSLPSITPRKKKWRPLPRRCLLGLGLLFPTAAISQFQHTGAGRHRHQEFAATQGTSPILENKSCILLSPPAKPFKSQSWLSSKDTHSFVLYAEYRFHHFDLKAQIQRPREWKLAFSLKKHE